MVIAYSRKTRDYQRSARDDRDSVYGVSFSSLSKSVAGYRPIFSSIPISGRVHFISTYDQQTQPKISNLQISFVILLYGFFPVQSRLKAIVLDLLSAIETVIPTSFEGAPKRLYFRALLQVSTNSNVFKKGYTSAQKNRSFRHPRGRHWMLSTGKKMLINSSSPFDLVFALLCLCLGILFFSSEGTWQPRSS